MGIILDDGRAESYLLNHRTVNREYYNWVIRKVFKLKPDSIVEVGGGHILLSVLSSYFCKEKLMVDIRSAKNCGGDLLKSFGIDFLQLDIMEYNLPAGYDMLICLQMLEHLENPAIAIRRMWDSAKTRIFSVPFGWEPSPGHIHNHITEEQFTGWFPRKPDETAIVQESCGSKRIIGVWKD